MSCARYSSAASPTAEALTRSGMSLDTRVTDSALGRQVQRAGQDPGVVVSLRNPAGSTEGRCD